MDPERFSDEMASLVRPSTSMELMMSLSFNGMISLRIPNVEYRNEGNELRGEWIISAVLKSMPFWVQNSFILPPPVITTFLHPISSDLFSMLNVSTVFPDMLVDTTMVSLSTVLGSRYPLTTETCTLVFEKTASNMSPIVPDPPMPAKTMCDTSPKSRVSCLV